MAGTGRTTQTQATRWVPALSVLLVLAGGIHLAATVDHMGTAGLHGAFFLAVTATQFGLAVVVARRPERGPLTLAAVQSGAVAVVWAVSRTSGLPFGAHANVAEPALLLDLTATGLELGAVGVAVALLRATAAGTSWSRPARSPRLTAGLGGAALAATALAFVVGPAAAHDHHGAAPTARAHIGSAHVDTVHGDTVHGDTGHGDAVHPGTAGPAHDDRPLAPSPATAPDHAHVDGAVHDHRPVPPG